MPSGVEQRLEARVSAVEQVGERAVERHLAELEPGLVGLEAGDGADEVDDAAAALAAVRGSGARDRRPTGRSACQRPATRTTGALRGREREQLLLAELDVADREPPVERARSRRSTEQAARRRVRARAQVRPDAGAARAPRPTGAAPARLALSSSGIGA